VWVLRSCCCCFCWYTHAHGWLWGLNFERVDESVRVFTAQLPLARTLARTLSFSLSHLSALCVSVSHLPGIYFSLPGYFLSLARGFLSLLPGLSFFSRPVPVFQRSVLFFCGHGGRVLRRRGGVASPTSQQDRGPAFCSCRFFFRNERRSRSRNGIRRRRIICLKVSVFVFSQ